ncbi:MULTISPECIES: class I SAM-dependent methyltransferase [Streptomyces]|uniref:class I SAM-dependent methyltransferase n=1 Tax=Streptomyces TaxID=1883 RepID=UPI00163CCE59|nr:MULTISPECIES: class I SAM-dependent methyltransferase [Streptomyces]MBC2874300.1 methyltransferase domain-containing protein [Streptomyces sp. TYQ1024]UBI40335.1 methyltransferase domain-containing protein [Streptomyces mobaraensis]UKW32915.1 methyltransferase domain-containing protein [Streptomyces sp. TYQ1024]
MTTTDTDAASWATSARIYNSAVAAWAIGAAWEVGALDELQERGSLDTAEFAARHDLDPASTLGMFRALASVGVVRRDGTRVVPAEDFAEIHRTRSLFHWLMNGSGELFRQMPSVLRNENRAGTFYQRDPVAIARSCKEISVFCYDPWFWRAMEGLDFDVRVAADLGCGSGERLMQILRRHPDARGLGVDIAGDSLKVAAADAADAGLAGRLSFVEADMLTMDPRPEFTEVDLLTCFMAGHDFWPREQCVATLARLRELFPNARRFLLGDATRSVGVPDAEMPVFMLGFEVAHDLMGTFMPTMADWEGVFAESGWRLRHKHDIGMVANEVIFELEPR